MKLRPYLACLLFSLAPAASALQPYRVADVNPLFHSGGSSPEKFVRVGPRALFTAKTPGPGLWSSDGTPAGTRRILASASVDYVAATGEALFFQSCDAAQICQLRITDGTVPGTRVLPGSTGSFYSVAVAGARRIFFVGLSAASPGLWTSDGTPGGTRLVKRFEPGVNGPELHDFVWSRDRLWFFVGNALWISDGKTAGTRKVATVGSIDQVGAVGARLLFFVRSADDSETRLWSSDGTAQGTKALAVRADPSIEIAPFAVAGANAFLRTIERTPFVMSVIWVTDGTAAHTRRLATFDSFDAEPPVAVGSRVAFIARDEAHGSELWVSDGRPEGTRGLDICPGTCGGVSEIGAVDGARIWFSGHSPPGNVPQLWTSDLTPGGTRRVGDLRQGEPENFIAGQGHVYFDIYDGGSLSLWASDGTTGGTRAVVQQAFSDRPISLSVGAVVAGRAFFSVADDSHGVEPWISNGTVAGTKLVKDLVTAQDGGSFPTRLTAVGDRSFFFTLNDFGNTDELWVSDGTAAGTSLAYPFEEGIDTGGSEFRTVGVGSRFAWFNTIGFEFGEIWMSDGTPGGTGPIHSSDVRPNGQLRAVGGRLFFQAGDSDHGEELWASDGGPEGAIRLSDFPNPFPFADRNATVRRGFVEVAGGVAFLAADEFGRFEPWFSDGTIGGTRHLADVYPALVAPFFSLASEVVTTGGKIFFVSGTGPWSFWVSDLTVAGTRNLGPVATPGGGAAFPWGLAVVGNRALLFYSASPESGFWATDGTSLTLVPGVLPIDPELGAVPVGDRIAFRGDNQQGDSELYLTDGTAAGTTRITDTQGSSFGQIRGLAGLGERVAFVDYSGVWESDGTPAGTVRKLAPYPGISPQRLVRAGQRIFFPWYDVHAGTELWALKP